MRAGELDRVITIRQHVDGSPARDSSGGIIPNWVDVYTDLPAGKRAASGREVFAAAQNAAQIDTVFVTRYVTGIDTTMQVVFEGQEYDIQDVQEIGRREGLLIKARVKR